MRFKFAHAVSIAAAVAMASACGKKDEGGASTAAPAASSAAVSAASSPAPAPASEATVVRIGHVAPLTGLQAHLGKDNENGARLALEEISAQGNLEFGIQGSDAIVRKNDASHNHGSGIGCNTCTVVENVAASNQGNAFIVGFGGVFGDNTAGGGVDNFGAISNNNNSCSGFRC